MVLLRTAVLFALPGPGKEVNMHTEFLMGNAAIARGAIAAGVNLVAGYPGTPSTEALETVARYRTQSPRHHETGGPQCRLGSADEP